jgi:hypothetical protein
MVIPMPGFTTHRVFPLAQRPHFAAPLLGSRENLAVPQANTKAANGLFAKI